MKLIEIGERNYLLYLVPHRATEYDRIHRYEDDARHEYPARLLVTEVWSAPGRGAGEGGYGRVLELGAGSGYFTALIARRARSVIAVEPVADLRRVVRERCAAERLDNVEVIGATAFDLGGEVPAGSIDSAFIIQSLHHFHRRPEVFAELGRATLGDPRLCDAGRAPCALPSRRIRERAN